jgi:hypothetical protein
VSPRDRVLEASGRVVAARRRTWQEIPEDLKAAIGELEDAISAMNAEPRGPSRVRIAGHRLEVLALLRQRPRTDEELVACLSGQMSASGARTRRAELVRAGLVRKAGYRRKSATGRALTVWAAV